MKPKARVRHLIVDPSGPVRYCDYCANQGRTYWSERRPSYGIGAPHKLWTACHVHERKGRLAASAFIRAEERKGHGTVEVA